MARKTRKQRTEEQRVRQAELRKAARKARRPDRDDIARLLLWQMISGIQARSTGQREMLDKLRNKIIDGLEAQGFDSRESEEVFEDLAKRYSNRHPAVSPRAASQTRRRCAGVMASKVLDYRCRSMLISLAIPIRWCLRLGRFMTADSIILCKRCSRFSAVFPPLLHEIESIVSNCESQI